MKQKRIAEKLREVESAISAKFEQAQRQQGTVIDINAEKDRWISTMENLKPDSFCSFAHRLNEKCSRRFVKHNEDLFV